MTEESAQATSSDKEKNSVDKPRKPRVPRHYKARLYGAMAVAVLLAGGLAWQLSRNFSQRDQYASERADLVGEHAQALEMQAEQLLRASGVLLSWALAEPLAAESFDVIEERIKPLVREESIAVVAIADASLVIRLATNHKLEGKKLNVAFPGIAVESKDLAVTHLGPGSAVVVPVFHAGQEVGRGVIVYQRRRERPGPLKVASE